MVVGIGVAVIGCLSFAGEVVVVVVVAVVAVVVVVVVCLSFAGEVVCDELVLSSQTKYLQLFCWHTKNIRPLEFPCYKA